MTIGDEISKYSWSLCNKLFKLIYDVDGRLLGMSSLFDTEIPEFKEAGFSEASFERFSLKNLGVTVDVDLGRIFTGRKIFCLVRLLGTVFFE